MILVRTPLRVSLFGGGSDLPSFYNNHGGTVLSTTIDEYMYIALCKTSYEGVKVTYTHMEMAKSADRIQHTRVRECLKEFNIDNHIEISSFATIPTVGTGLGSSSTFTVGLIKGLCHLTGRNITKYELAELASEVEINRCYEPIGKQDQYAAAFGGFNLIHFTQKGTIVAPLNVTQSTLNNLNNNFLMFYTGIKRATSDILKPIVDKKNDKRYIKTMLEITKQAEVGAELLMDGKIDDVGRLLNEAWKLKRSLSDGISNEVIDSYYNKAIKAGAYGGKILGAGGGGFLLFYVLDEYRPKVIEALSDLKQFNFNFENDGSTIVYG